jgi:DNA polymerase III epsilon subunit-like protein
MTRTVEEERRRIGLWADLRIVVIDVETTGSFDGDRVLSAAAVTLAGGRIVRTWNQFFNPGCPITRRSQKVHGLTAEFLAPYQPFHEHAQELLDEFQPASDTQQVIIAGHYVNYDVARLRSELRRAGADLPNLRVIDTRNVAKVVGVPTKDGSLGALLDALGLINAKSHDAVADATATALALSLLIDRGLASGVKTIGGIAGWSGNVYKPKTTHQVRPAKTGTDTSAESRLDPSQTAAHQTKHATRPRDWDQWVAVLDECQQLRCPAVPDRAVTAAQRHPAQTLDLLREHLDTHLAEPGASRDSVAVLVQALGQTLAAIGDRDLALDTYRAYAATLSALPTCVRSGTAPCCRYCEERQPCPVDTWHQHIGRPLVDVKRGDGGRKAHRLALLDPAAPTAGVVAQLQSDGDVRLAGWVAWLVGTSLIATEYEASATFQAAWNLGLREPRIADTLALPLAISATWDDLTGARGLCEEALTTRGASTDDGWLLVTARQRQVQSGLERLRRVEQAAGLAPVPTRDGRRHTAKRPRKVHPLRFRVE